MKNKLLWILLSFILATQAVALESSSPLLAPMPQQADAANLSAQILSHYHYKAMPLDDALSAKIFDRYLKSLDPEKFFFLQSDIDKFSGARTQLDDAIAHQDLNIPFAIFNLYERRAVERLAYAKSLLKQGFDFTQNESYQIEREKEPWLQSEDAIRDLWRKRVKNDWLRLKLANKDDNAIRDTLNKRYDNALARITKYKSEDVFQIFMDAYATSTDPHTDYLGKRASEDFDISMSLSLVGIGAVLQEKDEYTTIRELVPGGPAAQSGKLKVGDRIIGVGQGSNSTPTDVVGWRIDDVVRLIRGTKDSVVLLDILPADASQDAQHKRIPLVRDKITLDKQAAKKSILEFKTGDIKHKVGVITLPTFYQDFDARVKGDKEFKSATRDVAHLLDELKKEKVESVLIDLRNNGGGSLNEAVDLTSLFIGKGPVVQQRDSRGDIRVELGKNPDPAWGGPLGVLINRGSASASEIFAAAIQDYGRGLIIGEQSYGKGTVQTMISLDQIAKNEKAGLGELKMTIAQFFRVNGGTTQLRGVTPDIGFPDISDTESFGESSFDNALPWAQIKSANYKPAGDLKDLVPMLQTRHDARLATDKDFQFMQETMVEYKAQRKKNLVSLNESTRRKEREAEEERIKLHEKNIKTDVGLQDIKLSNDDAVIEKISSLRDDGLQANERNLNADIAAEKAQKSAKDVLLNEAAHILGDEAELLKIKAPLVVRATADVGARKD
ncbi:MAG TPA: carboxy terminal-processing peptidase [Burkholderiaceae bacterium]|jgi:carboxyl-terminal processing protease